MRIYKAVSVSVVVLILLSSGSPSRSSVYAWDGDTHIWIVLRSIDYLPHPWSGVWLQYSNELRMGALAPDRVFRDFYNHVYHPESGYGGAPWAVERWFGYVVGNLSLGDHSTAVFSAGVLSHYVADVANPLHTGSSGEEKVIHSDYEMDVSRRLSMLAVGSVESVNVTGVAAYVVSIAQTSHGHYWPLINNYTRYGWNIPVERITEDCLSLATQAIVSLWSSAISSAAPPSPSEGPARSQGHVVINEVELNPPGSDEGFEWVELYNPTPDDVDIGGWTLSTTHGVTVSLRIPETAKISGYGYYVVSYGGQWLDNEDESVILKDAKGREIDRTPLLKDTFNDGRSWQRYPNGLDMDSVDDWIFKESTKGGSNGPRRPSKVTCTVSKPSIMTGESIVVSGELIPALIGNLTILYECPDGSIMKRNVTSGSDGRYSDIFVPVIAGTWSVRAYWMGDDQYEPAVSPKVTVTVSRISTIISCSISHQEILIGNTLVVSGYINPPVLGKVLLFYHRPDGSLVIRNVDLNPDGSYRDEYTPTIPGSWSVQARWEGDTKYLEASSPMVKFIVSKLQSTLSCQVSSSNISFKDSVMISGSINPPLQGITVTISYKNDTAWNLLAKVATTSEGSYSYYWTPASPGTYQIRASWEGDATYSEAISSPVSLVVERLYSLITCSISPSKASYGEKVRITGQIIPVIPGVKVSVRCIRPDSSIYTKIVETDSTGMYSFEYSPDKVGLWSVEAFWPGDNFHLGASSERASFEVVKAKTIITISPSSTTINEGDEITFSGSIKPPPGEVILTLIYTKPDGSTLNRTVRSSVNGDYVDNWKPSPGGSWSVRACWEGGENYEGAVSSAVSFTVKGRGCIIATATYGSELSPQVQYLREFRDQIVLSTFAGSQFMKLFNSWYYSFSPMVASLITVNEPLRLGARIALYPLMGILHLSASTYYTFSLNKELGIVLAGLVASSFIGAVYLAPTLIALSIPAKPLRKLLRMDGVKLLATIWLASLTSTVIGEMSASPDLITLATGLLVLTTLTLSAKISASGMVHFLKRLCYS